MSSSCAGCGRAAVPFDFDDADADDDDLGGLVVIQVNDSGHDGLLLLRFAVTDCRWKVHFWNESRIPTSFF